MGVGVDTSKGKLSACSRHMIAVSNQINVGGQFMMVKQFGGKNGVFTSVHAGVFANHDGFVGVSRRQIVAQPRRFDTAGDDGQ